MRVRLECPGSGSRNELLRRCNQEKNGAAKDLYWRASQFDIQNEEVARTFVASHPSKGRNKPAGLRGLHPRSRDQRSFGYVEG